MAQYLILQRGPDFADASKQMPTTLWADLGEVGAGYPQSAVEKVAETHGTGEYLVISSYGSPERFTVTERTEYVVERVVSEPTASEPFVPALEPPF